MSSRRRRNARARNEAARRDDADRRAHFTAPEPSPEYAPPATRGDRIGEVLGDRYELVEVIGRGGSGVVYRAHQASVERNVAVKVLFLPEGEDGETMRHFEREARIIGRLRHPNTISLYDCGRTRDGAPFIVTELLHGTSLGIVLRNGPLDMERAVHVSQQIAGSLAEAHGAGIVHRDIKPENVFLDSVDGEDFVKLLDFGIAHDPTGARLTRPGFMLGTPAYMAPEQAAGEQIDRRADVYGLGVLIYQMITGEPPFVGATVLETLAMHLSRPLPRLWGDDAGAAESEAAFDLETLVLAMMAKSPDDRPQSMVEVRKSLEVIERSIRGQAEARSELRSDSRSDSRSDRRSETRLAPSPSPAMSMALVPAMRSLVVRADPPPQLPAITIESPREIFENTLSEPVPFDAPFAIVPPKLTARLIGLLRENHLARIGVALICLALVVAVAAKLFVAPHG